MFCFEVEEIGGTKAERHHPVVCSVINRAGFSPVQALGENFLNLQNYSKCL
jgi:hypothetical protein